MHWASKDAFDRATAGDPVINATRIAIRQFIEGAGPLPHEVVEVIPPARTSAPGGAPE